MEKPHKHDVSERSDDLMLPRGTSQPLVLGI